MALGRSNWLFAGSLRAGQRAAAVMSLIQSARMNGHDPYAYLKDVLTRLPTHKASRIEELLPHRWQPRQATSSAIELSACCLVSPPTGQLLKHCSNFPSPCDHVHLRRQHREHVSLHTSRGPFG